MRKIYALLAVLGLFTAASAQITLPIDFESNSVTYSFTNFDGGNASRVPNPQSGGINTSAQVGRMVKGPGGQPWGGAFMTLSGPIDFSTNRLFRMKVFAPKVGTKVLLKVENESSGGIFFQQEVATTTANTWEDLSFDFSAIVTSNQYHKVVIIFDLGTAGNGSADFTYLFDDIRLISSGSPILTSPTLPLDFESNSVNWAFVNFGGGVTTRIDNPQPGTINTSSKVAQMVKNAGEVFGGGFIQLAGPIDFSTNKIFKVKVYSPRVGAKMLLKVENQANGGIFFEREVSTTVANAWEDMTFDFSAINTANQYHKVVIIFDNGTAGDGSANYTFLMDDFRLVASGGGPLTSPTLPLDFESNTVNWAFTDFDGGSSSRVANPQSGGINTSAQVARLVKNAGATWAGSLISLASPIDFSTNKTFKLKVYSPRVGAKVLLKVENQSNGGIFFEREVSTTVANAWEELTFDYSAINTANQYQKVVFIFDNGTAGDGSANFTFLVDDLRLVSAGGGGGGLTQMNLPVTFDATTVDYGLIGFGGSDGTIVTDPTNANNKVARVIKSAGAQTWAGTTVTAAAGLGFSSKIPFTASATTMTVRVWSPDAGIPVRLKVEDHTNPNISVETDATTTVANGWQTLTFNFANHASGTAALNLANNYTKASIFFNFGTAGGAADKTYYFDDMQFGSGTLPVSLTQFKASNFQGTVQLAWVTASETNNKGFSIERSTNGRTWSEMAFVKSKGNSTLQQTYQLADAQPNRGTNYYRLKQIDLDGRTSYSAVRLVNIGSGAKLLLYPNPVRDQLTISGEGWGKNATYQLIAHDGKVAASGKLAANASLQTIATTQLPAGVYTLQVTDGSNLHTERFVKQ